MMNPGGVDPVRHRAGRAPRASCAKLNVHNADANVPVQKSDPQYPYLLAAPVQRDVGHRDFLGRQVR